MSIKVNGNLKIWLLLACLLFWNCSVAADINVVSFGANGRDRKDDTESIQKAINHARSQGASVVIPAGTYYISKIDIVASVRGVGTAILKKLPETEDEQYEFCVIKKNSGISVTGLVFDGSHEKSRPLSGAIPLFVHNSQDIEIRNCEFINSPISGLRIESAKKIRVFDCITTNSKGTFGDGFYVENSSDISFNKCSADSYSRIGFVVERNSHNITFDSCNASNGKEASSLTGGGEFNAGFWYEGSGNIVTKNCKVVNNTHFGFVATSGMQNPPGNGTVKFIYQNCSVINAGIGFRVSSSGNPVNITLKKSTAKRVSQGFIALARDRNDSFEISDSSVDLVTDNPESFNDIGFMWESSVDDRKGGSVPVFKFTNCRVNYESPVNTAKLFSRDANNGDVGTYGGGTADIYIENFTNSLASKGVVIKAIRGQPRYFLKNTKANLDYLVRKKNVIFR